MNMVLPLGYEEKDLIQACANKERWAQKLLYEEYYSSMMRVCLCYTKNKDEAADLLHEGFLKVFKYIAKYQPGTSLNGWIRRVMVNNCIDFIRKSAHRHTEDLDTAYSVSTDEPDALSKCCEQDILEAVQTLSPIYRTIFVLYVIEGYSHKEIADQLEISESSCRSSLVKARGKLKEILSVRMNLKKYYEE
jgi:RNA polymerase sigma factor (sigma-70 family)